MGVVLGATDVRTGRAVAVKVLRAEGLGDPDTMRRFEREARALGKVSSAHVAHVDAFGYHGGGPYLVLERLVGTTLSKVLEARGKLTIAEAVTLAREIALGLEAAHAASVVHRDLKPSNVFLAETSAGPVVKVIDFGVCSMQTEGEVTITRTAATVGTPSYMAPEQVTSPRDVDPRADLWSLGVVLYEMLAGEKPFRGASMGAVFAAILSSVPPSIVAKRPDCPPALAALVGRCLERDPSLRPASAAELARALSELSGDTSLAMTFAGPAATSAPGDTNDTILMPAPPVGIEARPAPTALEVSLSAPSSNARSNVARVALVAAALVLVGVGVLAAGRGSSGASSATVATAPAPSAEPPAPSTATPPPPPIVAEVAAKPSATASSAPAPKPPKATKKKPVGKPGELDPRLIDTL